MAARGLALTRPAASAVCRFRDTWRAAASRFAPRPPAFAAARPPTTSPCPSCRAQGAAPAWGLLGVSLAVNGVTEGKEIDQPGKLPRTMAFANSIRRSKWYADALMESEVLRATTRRMQDGRAMKVPKRPLACASWTRLVAPERCSWRPFKPSRRGLRPTGSWTTGSATALHKTLVEDVLCGLDINRHAIQLAACNMTLGAPTVDYERMNLLTMRHGPQSDDSVRAGSLELLAAADREVSLGRLVHPLRTLGSLGADQVDRAEKSEFPLEDLDLVIMNPPFTESKKRGRKFGSDILKRMQRHELDIRDNLQQRDPSAGGVITINSIRSFFGPIAEKLLHSERRRLGERLTCCRLRRRVRLGRAPLPLGALSH